MGTDRFVRLDEHVALGHTMFRGVISKISESRLFNIQHGDIERLKSCVIELLESLPVQARVILTAIAALTCLQLLIHRVRRVRMYKDHLKRL